MKSLVYKIGLLVLSLVLNSCLVFLLSGITLSIGKMFFITFIANSTAYQIFGVLSIVKIITKQKVESESLTISSMLYSALVEGTFYLLSWGTVYLFYLFF